MWSFIASYWIKQTGKEKLFILIILALLLFGIGKGAQAGYYKYQYFKQIEKEYKTLKEITDAANKKEGELIGSITDNHKTAKKKNADTDKKLKEDEATINDSDVSDDDILEFISKHQK